MDYAKFVVALEILLKFNMASRFYKIGSIFSRVNGFMRKGFVKYEERPLWYDVYAQFPPKYEPKFSRPASEIEIQDIFFTEDVIRAKVHKKFSHKLGIYNLNDECRKSNSQSWLETYDEFIEQGMSEGEALKQLEELIEKPVQNSVFDYDAYTEIELSPPAIPLAKTISMLKISNINSDKDEETDASSLITTILKSGKENENINEDFNVDETIEVSRPIIPMSKTVSKPDEKNKDSRE